MTYSLDNKIKRNSPNNTYRGHPHQRPGELPLSATPTRKGRLTHSQLLPNLVSPLPHFPFPNREVEGGESTVGFSRAKAPRTEGENSHHHKKNRA